MNATQKIEKGSAVEDTNLLVPMTPARRRRESGERGSTLFEFAMVAVITLVLMFGMIDLARALYSYHFVTTAAREAARYASVRGYLCSTSVSDCAGGVDVDSFAKAVAPQGIDKTKVHGMLTPGLNNMPVCGSTPDYPGCLFQVTVTYTFTWIFPVNFYSLAPVNFQAGQINMSSTSEMIYSR